MTLFALILVFIPFFSLPPFVSSSYVQPFTLLAGWSVLIFTLDLRFSKNVFSCLLLFIVYILLLKFVVFGGGFIASDLSVLIAYFVGFFQILLLLSLFCQAFSRCVSGDMSLFNHVQRALAFSTIIIAASVPLQLIGPVGKFFEFIKPRTVELSESGLGQSYRGLSGLMPEPSYLGTCLGILLLSSFLLKYFGFASLQLNSSSSQIIFPPNDKLLDLANYSRCLKFFLSTNLAFIFLSLAAVFLAFSPTSVLSFVLIVSSAVIPFLAYLLAGFVRRGFLKYLVFFIFLAVLFLILSNVFFGQSRLASILSVFASGDFSKLVSLDASVSDRYASSALGAFSVSKYPIGLGLNGHGYLMANCDNHLVQFLGLMCGTIWNSSRSHNATANLLIDGGLFAILAVGYLLINAARLKRFLRFSLVQPSLKFSLAFFPIFIFLLFVVLPAPLGSPLVWLPFSVALALLRELPSAFRGSVQ